MLTEIINFLEAPSLLDIITIVLAISVIFVFNKHTKISEQHTMAAEKHTTETEEIEIQRINLELYRITADRIYANLEQIHEESIVKIVSSLKENQEVVTDEIKKLMILIIKCDYSLQSTEEASMKTFSSLNSDDTEPASRNLKTNLSSEIRILDEFIVQLSKLLFENRATLSVLEKEGSELYEVGLQIYNSYRMSTDGGISADNRLTKNGLILMVAMRKNKTSKGWAEQSLGGWIVSNKKIPKITHILGINVETRNIVSFVKVTKGIPIGNSNEVRFEQLENIYTQEKNKKPEKSITIDEATYWNPQNPIRYIDRTPEYIEQLTQVSTPTENI